MKVVFYFGNTSVSISFPFVLPDSLYDCVDVSSSSVIDGFSHPRLVLPDSSVSSEDGFRSTSYFVVDSDITFDIDNRS